MISLWRCLERLISIERWTLHWTVDLHLTATASGSKQIKIGRLTWSTSNGSPDLHRTADILREEPRSTRDRGPIVARSWSDRPTIVPNRRIRILIYGSSTIAARSPGNQNPIAARSCPRSGLIQCQNWEDSSRDSSDDPAQRNFSHDPIKSRPRPRQLPTIFGLMLPLKSHVFLPCSSTFDRFVKELSEFRGRSLVHRDPPAFRLDCEAIGAGLIANFSLISSNFPLEFRTSARKNPSKFASIHENWSPILAGIGLVVRFNRLSGGNLSFY